ELPVCEQSSGTEYPYIFSPEKSPILPHGWEARNPRADGQSARGRLLEKISAALEPVFTEVHCGATIPGSSWLNLKQLHEPGG
ncbi:MAG TPA: hypothetical protein VIS71_04720, partial [Terrimicrobium sp.]